MKNRLNTWFYPGEELGGGVCPWCDDRGIIIKFKTSDGEKLNICTDCTKAARRLSIGSFLLAKTTIPLLIKWRRNKVISEKPS